MQPQVPLSYDEAEAFALELLRQMATHTAITLRAAGIDESLLWQTTTEILWGIAGTLESNRRLTSSNGRELLPSLGAIACGSKSAFESPFIEEKVSTLRGVVALHELVHTAVHQAAGAA